MCILGYRWRVGRRVRRVSALELRQRGFVVARVGQLPGKTPSLVIENDAVGVVVVVFQNEALA